LHFIHFWDHNCMRSTTIMHQHEHCSKWCSNALLKKMIQYSVFWSTLTYIPPRLRRDKVDNVRSLRWTFWIINKYDKVIKYLWNVCAVILRSNYHNNWVVLRASKWTESPLRLLTISRCEGWEPERDDICLFARFSLYAPSIWGKKLLLFLQIPPCNYKLQSNPPRYSKSLMTFH
jgi:hypothetical protein